MAAISVAFTAGAKALEKFWARRQAKNGNGHGRNGNGLSVASQKLEKWDMDWRKDVDDELEKFQRAIYEPGGALREGDHNVRKDVTAVISQMATTMSEQHRELRADFKTLAGELKDIARTVAARANCCEHCEKG